MRGTITDAATKAAIPFASIAVYDTAGLVVGGTVANENGVFEFKTGRNFTHLQVSFMGYETLRRQASELPRQHQVNLALNAKTEWLKDVTVNGKRTNTQLKIDRKIVNLGSDIQQSGVSALEAFDHIPEVETNIADGTVSLRGSENVQILVNGKPSSLSATELLQQIQAATIDRVEIITSPSGRYRADGISGIINIILKKEQSTGLNLTGARNHRHGKTRSGVRRKLRFVHCKFQV